MRIRKHPSAVSYLEDCTLALNSGGGIHALGASSVEVRGCRSRGNGGAGYMAEDDAQLTVFLSSSDGEAEVCMEGVLLGRR